MNHKPVHNTLTEEETFERFQKKGWICNICKNFNYQNRIECNRCKMEKVSRKKYYDVYTGLYVETKKELTVNNPEKLLYYQNNINRN